MAQLTLLRGTLAAGEGVVRLEPNRVSPDERWLASISEPHLSQIAVGARRLRLRDAVEQIPDWYLGPGLHPWNVHARWDGQHLLLQPIEDAERGPASARHALKPGSKLTLRRQGPSAILVLRGAGFVSRVPVQSPAESDNGRLLPDEVFVSGDATGRGVIVRNTGDTPLEFLEIYCQESA